MIGKPTWKLTCKMLSCLKKNVTEIKMTNVEDGKFAKSKRNEIIRNMNTLQSLCKSLVYFYCHLLQANHNNYLLVSENTHLYCIGLKIYNAILLRNR